MTTLHTIAHVQLDVYLSLWQSAYVTVVIIFAGTALASTFLVPVAMTLYVRRANAPGTTAALLAGFVAVVLLYNVPALKDFMGFHPIVWALIASALAGTLVTALTPPLIPDRVAFYFDNAPAPTLAQIEPTIKMR